MNTTEEQKKKGIFTVLGDRFGKLPRWGKVLSVLGTLVVVLAVAGFAYVNGKLDLLRYSDGTIDGIGTIDADEDQVEIRHYSKTSLCIKSPDARQKGTAAQ